MLLRFRVGNHLSLRDPQELSMAASKAIKDDDAGLIECPAVDGKLVPAAVIYGANASGKSNVVRALDYMCTEALHSQSALSRYRNAQEMQRTPFALDPASRAARSHYEIDFALAGIRYRYGFEVSNSAFEREWLHAYPSGRVSALLEREGQIFKFGRNLKGQNQVISELTRPDSLFLSAAAQNNHEQLTKISSFFGELRIEQSEAPRRARFRSEPADPRVIGFLERAGTGVVDARLVEARHGTFAGSEKSERPTEIQLGHRGSAGRSIYFNLEDESDGTRRLLTMMESIYAAIDRGSVVVVDEIDKSLHTQACEAILGLFCNRKNNPKGAQLIATTHDTNLLRSHYIRRDQIWFTEKDDKGATHLYPLTDIATRQGENIEKGYLHGRFGAVPFAGAVSDLAGTE